MHQCVKCGTLHDDGSQDLLKGCSCGGKFFFFIKKEHLEEAKEITENLSDKEKDQIKKDVLDIVGLDSVDDNPVILDLESIKVMKPGKYDIDLIHLFKGMPLIYRLEEGKYIIDIASSFQMEKKK
ncbi:MAG TPA: Zn-ribbon containing protein [Candidatus Nanoarchaeia archaeon]|nr:Zn-ribbon containing protein [Candidatus Nanoarchaeia archaeon]